MLQAKDLKGVFVPVVTPFASNGELDLLSYDRYLENLFSHPIQGIVVNGTTGEAPSVEWSEAKALFHATRAAIQRLGVDVPIIVGTGTNNTRTTVERTIQAGAWGADAALVVTPYYSRPSESGIYRHFEAVVETGFPLIAYEVPERTGVRVSAETMLRILDLDGVIGLKDATGGVELLDAIAKGTAKAILAGSDDMFARMLRRGASGGFLASANLRTSEFLEVNRLAVEGLYDEADEAFDPLLPLVRLLFRETNPAPIKWVLAQSGILASETLRLPLTPISPSLQEELTAIAAHSSGA
jgi:4-hydroxy-tetrahydrodipicolinate synthase